MGQPGEQQSLEGRITDLQEEVRGLRNDLASRTNDMMGALNAKDVLERKLLRYVHDAERWRAINAMVTALGEVKRESD